MPFEKGKPKTGGRLPGVSNKLTGAFRDAVRLVYGNIGGHEAFSRWAQDNPTEFYRIASRLIPGEMQGEEGKKLTVIVYGPQPGSVQDAPKVIAGTVEYDT
jgi:hypothetical protein